MCPDVSAFQTDVCQHSVIKAFQACLYPATMSIGFDIVHDAAQLPYKVKAGSIAHFDGTVCNDDDHFISPFSTRLRKFLSQFQSGSNFAHRNFLRRTIRMSRIC